MLCFIVKDRIFGTESESALKMLNYQDVKLCLTMIVKNESKIIERCLDSVRDIVDCISICDTGSTDDTVEIIERYMKLNCIAGKVHRHIWKDFGHNRSLSATAAEKTIKELGFDLSHTYLLLLDADMVLNIASRFDKEKLNKSHYSLVQRSIYMSHYNIRLIKASLPWKCIGVTHEYWGCRGYENTERLETLWIDDRDDGGCKTDKFERDVYLLKQGLEKEPNNSRYMFYLAQSYKCLKQYNEAIKWYIERINQQGWREEVWYAKLMLGEIFDDMEDWNEALRWYLDAYQYNSERAEPLEKIACHYRLKEQYNLGYIFAAHGTKIPYPTNQSLFISDPVYDYRFDEELAITAYYTPFREEGFAAEERLLQSKNIPAHSKLQAEKNLRFYVKKLDNICLRTLSIEPPMVREGTDFYTNPMNPSIIKTADGYLAIYRCVNYRQKGSSNEDLIIKARNYLLWYDKEFNLLYQKEIPDDTSPSIRYCLYSKVEDLEDANIFMYDQGLWATWTVQDINLHKIDDATEQVGQVPIEHCNIYEKNWLPFIKDRQIHVIHSYDPLIIYKVDPLTGKTELIAQHEQTRDFSSFRGSTGPIPFDNGYLVIIHHVTFENERYYFHRFLYLDETFNIAALSKPFTFSGAQLEYCCGMSMDHSESNLIISLGIENREALLAFIDLAKVRSLLLPIK